MAISFKSFFKIDNPTKTKVKFNMTAGRGGKRAWDNLQNEEDVAQGEWYNMCAHRSESGQASNNLEHYDYLLSFAQYYPYGPEFYIFGGFYKVKDSLRSKDKYELELLEDFKEYRKRLIIKLEKPIGRDVYSRRYSNVCESLNAIIYEVKPEKNLTSFPGYNNFILTHYDLQRIINNEELEWKEALSHVKGVYCITDTKTGEVYIGSAYNDIEGIWGRWRSYANIKNLTGGNKYFENLKKKDKDYIIRQSFAETKYNNLIVKKLSEKFNLKFCYKNAEEIHREVENNRGYGVISERITFKIRDTYFYISDYSVEVGTRYGVDNVVDHVNEYVLPMLLYKRFGDEYKQQFLDYYSAKYSPDKAEEIVAYLFPQKNLQESKSKDNDESNLSM